MSRLLQDIIVTRAESQPDLTALSASGQQLTYGELEQRSNRLARVLRDYRCRRGDRVGVLLGAPVDGAVAMLGILKADAIYVPLAHCGSSRDLGRLTLVCRPACLLVDQPDRKVIEDALRSAGVNENVALGVIGGEGWTGAHPSFGRSDIAKRSGRLVASRNRPTGPAAMVFPAMAEASHGVVTTHQALVRALAWATEVLEVRPNDRYGIFEHADGRHVFETLLVLSAGGTVVSVPREVGTDPHQLIRFANRERLTHLGLTVDSLRETAAADELSPGSLGHLRHVIWWAGSVEPAALRYWTRRVAQAQFTSLYASPGAVTVGAYYRWPKEFVGHSGVVPIGAACPGQEVLVLTESLEPAAPGVTGALWVRESGAGPGYWGASGGSIAGEDQARGSWHPARGWRTRDRGFVDEAGQVHLVSTSAAS
jgi:non-ribosomal peptide synthetase component F